MQQNLKNFERCEYFCKTLCHLLGGKNILKHFFFILASVLDLNSFYSVATIPLRSLPPPSLRKCCIQISGINETQSPELKGPHDDKCMMSWSLVFNIENETSN
ncbi:hypothetical protein XENORESO_016498 [Xenotaenia resolanae]|uniref:Uncharacterized protein n=1 Tax=Xenotaenia resolanae TaxID=208358 RepID=A0ABV0W069_9TELE